MGYLRLPSLSHVLITTLLIGICSFGFAAAADCGARGGGPVIIQKKIVVDKNGSGQFRTVQAAINSILPGNDRWIEVQIKPGLYVEKVTIPLDKPCIFFNGTDRRLTTISFNAHSMTNESATFTSYPKNVAFSGITFKNSYNLYENPKITPALAVRVYGDKSIFYKCGFEGVQDTIWDAEGRHYFLSCYIEGAVDFIWGGGQSIYEDCVINSTMGIPPHNIQPGYVTAQARDSADDTSGFIFKKGEVVGAGNNTFLGRAYRAYSRVIFDQTVLSAQVAPLGWNAWNSTGKEGNISFSEVDCTGRGADKSGRVKWMKNLSRSDLLQQYSRSKFIDQDGWLSTQPLAAVIKPAQ